MVDRSCEVFDGIKTFMASSLGVFLYATITGVVGVVILLFFLSMFIAPSGLLLVLPAVVGFNSAATAFSLADKSRAAPFHKAVYWLSAACITLAGCTTILLFCPWEELFDGTRYFLSGTSALLFTALGAWIAGKSNSLQES